MTMNDDRATLQKTLYLVFASGLLTLVLWYLLYAPVVRWFLPE